MEKTEFKQLQRTANLPTSLRTEQLDFWNHIGAALQLATAGGAGSGVTMLFEEIRKGEDGEILYRYCTGSFSLALLNIELTVDITRARETEDHDKCDMLFAWCRATLKELRARNDRATAGIMLEILGVDEELDVTSYEYQSLGP
ncbi:hypothetical protein BJ742DRAFT_741363 [Cladochytrium replicatum]|nr:hypothetical protein BJ742DRAFT_741363 [Cladochytrium replicatum]